MEEGLRILYTGENSPEQNMAQDHQFLDELDPAGSPLLHHYDWAGPCATYGHFIKPEALIDTEAAVRHGLRLAKRPTGGGIIFHVSDLAFSFLLPSEHPEFSLNTLKNYALVNQMVVEAVARFTGGRVSGELLSEDPKAMDWACQHFCMAKPTKYDVVVGGLKVGGAAQRRRRQGFLHQGTISLASFPQDLADEILLPETKVAMAMSENSFTLLDGDWDAEGLQAARSELRDCLSGVMKARFSDSKL